MSRSGTLLSVCRRTGAGLIRNQVLRQAGYIVVTADGLDDALDAAYSGRFDLVIIGDLFNTHEKNLIATTARHSGAKVLCMFSESNPPDVRDATAFIHNLDGPERLVACVAALLRKSSVSLTLRMQERKFKIVKLTPIALATCERCNALFQSYERVEGDAEHEMKALFDGHHCEPAVVSNAVLEQPSVFFHTIAETQVRLVISTCCLCGRRAAGSDSEVLRVAEQAHDCANEGTSRERSAPIREDEH